MAGPSERTATPDPTGCAHRPHTGPRVTRASRPRRDVARWQLGTNDVTRWRGAHGRSVGPGWRTRTMRHNPNQQALFTWHAPCASMACAAPSGTASALSGGPTPVCGLCGNRRPGRIPYALRIRSVGACGAIVERWMDDVSDVFGLGAPNKILRELLLILRGYDECHTLVTPHAFPLAVIWRFRIPQMPCNQSYPDCSTKFSAKAKQALVCGLKGAQRHR